MSIEERSDQELPELHISEDEGPRCGKFVGKDGDQDLYCDLPQGHPQASCSAPVDNAGV